MANTHLNLNHMSYLLEEEDYLLHTSPIFNSIFIMLRTSLVAPTIDHLQLARRTMPRYCSLLSRSLTASLLRPQASPEDYYNILSNLEALGDIMAIHSDITDEAAWLDLQPYIVVTSIRIANVAFAYTSVAPICLLYSADEELEAHVRFRAAFLSRTVIRPDGIVVFQPNA